MSNAILIIYTGGTIGMKEDPVTKALFPFDFSQILEEIPEFNKYGYHLDSISFDPLIDSSDIDGNCWIKLGECIEENYDKYDGFVILHGTDTMAYSASALSFMLKNLSKPVIFTGSQLPIGKLRTDGKENLISAIEIAAQKREDGRAMVPEVCLYFENKLYRGNRITKYSADNFSAFRSPNYPVLADVGIHIKYNTNYINYPEDWNQKLIVNYLICLDVALIKIFPGIQRNIIKSVIDTPNLRGIILETYGSGNAPSASWFLDLLQDAVSKGIIILNISQCQTGSVDMDAYSTGITLKNIGVINGFDSTTEAAITKFYFLIGQHNNNETIKEELKKNICGEITPPNNNNKK